MSLHAFTMRLRNDVLFPFFQHSLCEISYKLKSAFVTMHKIVGIKQARVNYVVTSVTDDVIMATENNSCTVDKYMYITLKLARLQYVT